MRKPEPESSEEANRMKSRQLTLLRLTAAIVAWSQCVVLCQPPAKPPTIVDQVRQMALLMRHDSALDAAQRAVEAHPGEVLSHVALGEALRLSGSDAQGALAAFRAAQELAPTSPDAQFGIAACLDLMGNDREVFGAWTKFVELDPDGDRAWLVRRGLAVISVEPFVTDALDLAWAPDGQRLTGTTLRRDHVFVVPSDQPEAAKLLPTGDFQYLLPSWAPDGRRLVVERRPAAGRSQRVLCLLDPHGAQPDQVVPNEVTVPGMPRWSPDGRQIAYWSGTSTLIELTTPEGEVSRPGFAAHRVRRVSAYPAWTPDGQRLVFGASETYGPYDLFVGEVDDDVAPSVLYEGPGDDYHPVVSSTGRLVVFCSNAPREKPGGQYRLWAADLDEPGTAKMLGGIAGRRPSFSPDGRWLAVAMPRFAGGPGGSALVRLGGLPPSGVQIQSERGDDALTVRAANVSETPVNLTCTYDVFDGQSIRLAAGPDEPVTLEVQPAGMVEWTLADQDFRDKQASTVKLTVSTGSGARAVVLLGFAD